MYQHNSRISVVPWQAIEDAAQRLMARLHCTEATSQCVLHHRHDGTRVTVTRMSDGTTSTVFVDRIAVHP